MIEAKAKKQTMLKMEENKVKLQVMKSEQIHAEGQKKVQSTIDF